MAATEFIADSAFDRAWSGSFGNSDVRRLWPGTGKSFIWNGDADEIEAVFSALRVAAHPLGYRQISNGATPLLRRRDPIWIREVVLRIGPRTGSGAFLATVDLHLSSKLLPEARTRYWSRTQLGLPHVASKNLGELVVPHCRILIDLSHSSAAQDSVKPLLEFGLPWLDDSTRPEYWLPDDAAGLARTSPFDLATTFELVLAHQGWGPAGLFLERLLARNPLLFQAGEKTPEIARLKAAALAYDFI